MRDQEISFDQEKVKADLMKAYEDAEKGLPDDIFKFVTSLTPMINVDLLVRDDAGRVLLAWREDYRGAGWHIPGGIIRYKETAVHRISETAKKEFGCDIAKAVGPIKISEIFVPQRIRGHFISLLYECKLADSFDIGVFNAGKKETDDGFLRWFDKAPKDLVYGQQEAYGDYLKGLMSSP